jgi:hypothetical protein
LVSVADAGPWAAALTVARYAKLKVAPGASVPTTQWTILVLGL